MTEEKKRGRVLALYPHRRGLSYALLDGNRSLRAYGRRWIPADKRRKSLQAMRELLVKVWPGTVVMQDPGDPDHGRCKRIHRLLECMRDQVKRQGLPLTVVTRAARSYAFRGRDVANKDDRAKLIAQLYPVLQRRLPRPREVWDAESESMGVFDAMALALTAVGVPEEPVEDEVDRFKHILACE